MDKRGYRLLKGALDRTCALLGLLVLSPLFLLLCALIRLDSRGPVFFSQRRIGVFKREFLIYKFRTMRTDTPHDVPTHLLGDPQTHITRMGRFLRATSLDELPQLYNILRGDMSVVGPRPALWNQFDLIAARDRCGANDVLPGLTGWAQVNGRDALEIADKARYDGEYAANFGLKMDLRCFFRSIGVVFSRAGFREGRA